MSRVACRAPGSVGASGETLDQVEQEAADVSRDCWKEPEPEPGRADRSDPELALVAPGGRLRPQPARSTGLRRHRVPGTTVTQPGRASP